MSKCINAPGWPGTIKAVVWDAVPGGDRRALEVGTLAIINLPLSTTTSSTLGDNATSTSNHGTLALGSGSSPSSGRSSASGTSLGIPGPLEKRWLKCWAVLFYHALTHRAADIVTDHMHGLHPEPGKAALFHFFCANKFPTPPAHQSDTLDIIIYPPSPGGHSLTFGQLIPAMLTWIHRVAATEHAYNLPEPIRDDSHPSARYAGMAIILNSPSNDVATTA